MNTLTGCIHSIGVLGPGLGDWASTRAVLRGELPHVAARTVLPPPAVLPPAERRRAGRVIKLALAVGAEAAAGATGAASVARELPTVFTSSGGDGDNCHEICAALASRERHISPTRFHNSVHNAAAGYWSIAYGCTEASTSLCAGDASFGAGLLGRCRSSPAVPVRYCCWPTMPTIRSRCMPAGRYPMRSASRCCWCPRAPPPPWRACSSP